MDAEHARISNYRKEIYTMKKIITVVIAGILIAAMATSVFGATITGGRSNMVNQKKGEISSEELRTIFNNNQEITTLRNIEKILSSLFVQYLETKSSIITY